MTIDPTVFVAQGAPTVDQVKEVWFSIPVPTVRHVAEILNRRGFEISWRTVARYKAEGFRPLKARKPLKPRTKEQRDQDDARQIVHATMTVVENIVREQAEQQAAEDGEAPPIQPAPAPEQPQREMDPEERDIQQRFIALQLMTEKNLRKLATQSRLIAQTIIMEQSAKKARALALIPKDMALLFKAVAETEAIVPLGQNPSHVANDDDKPPKTIEHEPTPVMNDIQAAVQRMREKNGR